jgi:glycosyltransferase involved in cell wall biosynthesis
MEKIKLFFLCDDIRSYSGVSNQGNKLLLGLQKTGKYEIIHGAVAIPHNKTPFTGKFYNYSGIKCYNLPSYPNKAGHEQIIDWILNTEKPDIFICFGDPRFFTYLFLRDSEIRTKCKFIFYHTWDNEPFPAFNIPWYRACDSVITISKLANKLLLEGGVENEYIPHGGDPSEFYKLSDEIIKEEKNRLLNQMALQFPITPSHKIVFWNNRNLRRKRPLDVIKSFGDYYLQHKNAVLLMHTDPVSLNDGVDLLNYQSTLYNGEIPVAFSTEKIDSQRLNLLYNIADVTINIAHSEGFGLCVLESLLAETPVIATKTGGMSEQMKDCCTIFGRLLEPDVRHLSGTALAPYIYEDYVSSASVSNALNILTDPNINKLGKLGRDHIITNYHINDTVLKWDTLLEKIHKRKSHFERFKLFEI